MRYAFVIDHSRCIGCHACSLACKVEHEVPVGSYRTWVKYVEKGTFPDVRRFFSVLRCNHCDNAPCVTICPVSALFTRDNGIVDFDREACIGCKACMQACPYDALHIHPDTGTAEKCNFCAHRVENEMEPPCATVCPTEAIVVGDIDDPAARVSRLIATKQVSVRKPEKGTQPKVFYIEGEPAALIPGIADPRGGYMWADRVGASTPDYPTMRYELDGGSTGTGTISTDRGAGAVPQVGSAPSEPTGGGTPPADWMGTDLPPAAAAQALASAAMRGEADFYTGAWAGLAPTRTVYDVAHDKAPWGWKVSAYLWTKSIAAGTFMVAAFAPWLGVAERAATIGAPLVGLLFTALTGLLLIYDLKRPSKFWTVLTRPNWSSWLARGAYIFGIFSVLGFAWSGAELMVGFGYAAGSSALELIRWPLVVCALAAAAYSGYLFAQAKGRDFWQNPVLPVHLSVQAFAAGAAAVVILQSHAADHSHMLSFALAATLALHLALVAFGEVTVAHATRDGARAAYTMVRGRYAGLFWTAIVCVVASFALALWAEPVGPGAVLCGLAALAGLAFHEHAWNQSGQAPPLS